MVCDVNRTRCMLAVAAGLAGAAGCVGPLDNYGGADAALRERVLAEHREALTGGGDGEAAGWSLGERLEGRESESDVERRLGDERLAELEAMSGPQSYREAAVEAGPDLAGRTDVEAVLLSLDEAVGLAVAANLDLASARLVPRIAEQRLLQAEAVFDAVLFANADWQKLDTPQPARDRAGAEQRPAAGELRAKHRHPPDAGDGHRGAAGDDAGPQRAGAVVLRGQPVLRRGRALVDQPAAAAQLRPGREHRRDRLGSQRRGLGRARRRPVAQRGAAGRDRGVLGPSPGAAAGFDPAAAVGADGGGAGPARGAGRVRREPGADHRGQQPGGAASGRADPGAGGGAGGVGPAEAADQLRPPARWPTRRWCCPPTRPTPPR